MTEHGVDFDFEQDQDDDETKIDFDFENDPPSEVSVYSEPLTDTNRANNPDNRKLYLDSFSPKSIKKDLDKFGINTGLLTEITKIAANNPDLESIITLEQLPDEISIRFLSKASHPKKLKKILTKLGLYNIAIVNGIDDFFNFVARTPEGNVLAIDIFEADVKKDIILATGVAILRFVQDIKNLNFVPKAELELANINREFIRRKMEAGQIPTGEPSPEDEAFFRKMFGVPNDPNTVLTENEGEEMAILQMPDGTTQTISIDPSMLAKAKADYEAHQRGETPSTVEDLVAQAQANQTANDSTVSTDTIEDAEYTEVE